MEFALPATGFLTILLAKIRCVWKGPCATCAYNDPHIKLYEEGRENGLPQILRRLCLPLPFPFIVFWIFVKSKWPA